MKYNVLKKFMVTGLASMLCLGGVSMADLSNYNSNTVTNVYAATIKDSAFSATGTINSNVSMRKGPGTSYTRLDTLKKGTKVTIVAKSSNNWYKIKFNGGYGYVYAQYITITNNSDNKEDKYPQTGVVNHAVYVRKGASTNYAKLGILNKNTEVTILSKTTYGWYKVQYKNGTGYVYSQYIDVNSTQK